jgi:hypothetical protein
MSPIPVFIDTSALPRNPAYPGAGFERMCQLANVGVIKIYLAEVVVEEWASQIKEEFLATVNDLERSLRKALRHYWFNDWPSKDCTETAYEQLLENKKDIDEFLKTKIDEILKQMGVIILPVQDNHGKAVLQSYFKGILPFRVAKSREDFPDAFIFEALKGFGIDQPGAHFIGADKRLSSAVTGLEGIILHPDIGEFVNSKVVLEQVEAQELEKRWIATLELISAHFSKYFDELVDGLESLLLDELPGQLIHHQQIPDDNGDAYIGEVYKPTDVEVDLAKIQNFGPGTLSTPFECVVDVGLDFFVYRGEAFNVPSGVWVEIGDFEEDHYFDAGGLISLSVNGMLSLKFDLSDIDEQGLPELINIGLEKIHEMAVIESTYGEIFHHKEDSEDE